MEFDRRAKYRGANMAKDTQPMSGSMQSLQSSLRSSNVHLRLNRLCPWIKYRQLDKSNRCLSGVSDRRSDGNFDYTSVVITSEHLQ